MAAADRGDDLVDEPGLGRRLAERVVEDGPELGGGRLSGRGRDGQDEGDGDERHAELAEHGGSSRTVPRSCRESGDPCADRAYNGRHVRLPEKKRTGASGAV